MWTRCSVPSLLVLLLSVTALAQDANLAALMHEHGISLATFDVRVAADHKLTVANRMYYATEDRSQEIASGQELAHINSTEIAPELDAIAIKTASSAGFFERRRGKHNVKCMVLVDVFAEANTVRVGPALWQDCDSSDLLLAAVLGDVATLNVLLNTPVKHIELDKALYLAAGVPFSNATVIELLLGHGANVNYEFIDAQTPLMTSVFNAANVKALLAHGADPFRRDKWGRTALQLAEQNHADSAASMLRQAMSSQPQLH
jgi:uncharacterized protein